MAIATQRFFIFVVLSVSFLLAGCLTRDEPLPPEATIDLGESDATWLSPGAFVKSAGKDSQEVIFFLAAYQGDLLIGLMDDSKSDEYVLKAAYTVNVHAGLRENEYIISSSNSLDNYYVYIGLREGNSNIIADLYSFSGSANEISTWNELREIIRNKLPSSEVAEVEFVTSGTPEDLNYAVSLLDNASDSNEDEVVESGQERSALTTRSDPDLCFIDRSGQRNGLWHTCYSLLRDNAGPGESIFCDTGMLSGEGHCRILPTALCSLVEGTTGEGEAPCMVKEDIDDPDRGSIGWRPVRTLRAQEPILEMAEFIIALAAASDRDQVLTYLHSMMEAWDGIDHTVNRSIRDESSDEFVGRMCGSGAALVNLMEALGHTSLRTDRILGLMEENNRTVASSCQAAVLCVADSYARSSIMFDGLREAYFVIEQFQCSDDYGLAERLRLKDDPFRQAVKDRSFGPASIAAARLIFEGDAMNDTELLRARADIHAHLIPEFDAGPNIFNLNRFEALGASSTRLPPGPGFPGYDGADLEFVLFDLMARRRGTTLPEIAAILLTE